MDSKAKGGIFVIIGSLLILVSGIGTRICNILDVVGRTGNDKVSTGSLVLLVVVSIIALLVYISVGAFGIRHKNNVDASRAVVNRGLFVLLFNCIILCIQYFIYSIDAKFLWTILIAQILSPVVYIIGGAINRSSRENV